MVRAFCARIGHFASANRDFDVYPKERDSFKEEQ
jgi:hypothetical protein